MAEAEHSLTVYTKLTLPRFGKRSKQNFASLTRLRFGKRSPRGRSFVQTWKKTQHMRPMFMERFEKGAKVDPGYQKYSNIFFFAVYMML